MSLLTSCQQVAREAKVGVPSTIISNNDLIAVSLLAAANSAVDWLAKRHVWEALAREHTITTVASQAAYAGPTDLLHYLDDTAWDRNQYWKMRGSLGAAEWQILKSGLAVSTGVRRNFRVKWDTASDTRKIFIDPTPGTAGETLVIEYKSNEIIQQADNSMITAWTADADTWIVNPDEDLFRRELLWRFKKDQGQAYFEEKDEAERALDVAIANDAPRRTVSMGFAGHDPEPVFVDNIPDTGFGT